jgi:hypothetical protein
MNALWEESGRRVMLSGSTGRSAVVLRTVNYQSIRDIEWNAKENLGYTA